MGIEAAVQFDSAQQLEVWIADNHIDERELWVATFKKSTGKLTVGFDALLEVAFCWGWVDMMTKGIDTERYAIRFVPRKPGSDLSETNRAIVCRLIAGSRMRPGGEALLPADLTCS